MIDHVLGGNMQVICGLLVRHLYSNGAAEKHRGRLQYTRPLINFTLSVYQQCTSVIMSISLWQGVAEVLLVSAAH